ncbi:MAG: alkaline phosphatase family protein, partial [Nitrososphaerota archaeon]|nr:alkaline phosphatase family protein [Nitrososphaerota archaeon]
HIEHTYGQGTDESLVEASLLSHAMQEGFLDRVDREAAKRTLILLTADHGQLTIEPEKTVYVNRFAKLTRSLQRNPRGDMIPPWGNARDTYYLVDENRLEETERYMRETLDGVATVMKTADGIKEGLFGINRPSRRFLRRVGNLMVLPHGNKTVFYRYKKGALPDLKGHHGGLTKDEMTIPLAAARLSDLQGH